MVGFRKTFFWLQIADEFQTRLGAFHQEALTVVVIKVDKSLELEQDQILVRNIYI